MKQRTITAIVLMLILVPLIVIDHEIAEYLYAFVAVLLCGIGGYEIMNVMHKDSPELKKYKFFVSLLSGILGGLCLLATYQTSQNVLSLKESYIYHFYPLLFFILSISLIMGLMIFTKNSEARAIMGCILALVYSGLMLGYSLSLRYFTPLALNNELIHISGFRSLAYVYIIAISTDTFAYIFGIKFGKTKLCPTISPKKSIVGAVAGLVFGTVIGTAVAYLFGIVTPSGTKEIILTTLVLLFVSAFISVVVQLGDLVESKIKRSFDTKDFGNIFPGHGGVLDRFDSLIYSGVWFYIIVQIIQIIILGA